MKDKFKSAILILLVGTSLWQSYLLAYGKPEFHPINQTGYIRSELTGTQKEILEMIYPNEIIIHFGENNHTILNPQHFYYNEIYSKLTKRSFDGLTHISRWSVNWKEYREKYKGLEITFEDGIPLNLLKSLFQIKGERSEYIDYIDRIWITTTENTEEVRAFFFSDRGINVYEATKVDLTVTDIAQSVGSGLFLRRIKNYVYDSNGYYYPETSLSIPKITLTYELFTPQRLQTSLFVDPSISRKLLERDGTEIYTDGKRGLQVNHRNVWMGFSDPVAPLQGGNDIYSNLLTAVHFVNQHGGWNGEFMLNDIPEDWDQTFIFRQYYNAYPIISDPGQPFGYIKVQLQKGIVSNYERSLARINIVEAEERVQISLPGGEPLKYALEQYNQRIVRIFPAYYPYISEGRIELIPKWAVKLHDGSYDYLY